MPRAKKKLDSDNEQKKVKKIKMKKKSTDAKEKVFKKITATKAINKHAHKTAAKPIIIDVIQDDDNDNIFPDLPRGFSENNENLFEAIDDNLNSEPIDKQKKFFSELVSEIKEKNPKNENQVVGESLKKENKPEVKSVNLYRRLVWRFMLGVGVLLLIIFYFSFSKLTIAISPNGETINDNILIKVISDSSSDDKNANDFREKIKGNVEEITLEEEKTFLASGEEFTGEEISGSVTIINTTNKSQALVATTRLLSPDNKLFRIKDSVTVPANGEVSAEIYVDKPSEDSIAGPTTFTIPGLWVGLQDKIYAKSSAPFVYRQKIKKYIKASDIDQAISELSSNLLKNAKLNDRNQFKNSETLYEFVSAPEFKYDVKPGEAKDSFSVKASGKIIKITFSKDDIYELTKSKLQLLVPDDKQLIEHSADSIVYKFENYDIEKGEATLKLNFSGMMLLKNNAQLIDKKKLVNLNREQLENYLKNFPEINKYELNFFPSFIGRAPRIPERIEISITGLQK